MGESAARGPGWPSQGACWERTSGQSQRLRRAGQVMGGEACAAGAWWRLGRGPGWSCGSHVLFTSVFYPHIRLILI